nr:MAG TPA: hypothetical protein [Caudoviricetes sp.]
MSRILHCLTVRNLGQFSFIGENGNEGHLHLFIPIRHVRFSQMRQSSNRFRIPAISLCRISPEIIHQEEQRLHPPVYE